MKRGKLGRNNTICKVTEELGCIWKAERIIWYERGIGRNRVGLSQET